MLQNLVNDVTIPSEQLFEISDEARILGLVVRYDTITYRDQEVIFLSDPNGDRCVAQWNNELVDLGLHNLSKGLTVV